MTIAKQPLTKCLRNKSLLGARKSFYTLASFSAWWRSRFCANARHALEPFETNNESLFLPLHFRFLRFTRGERVHETIN
jgi:hypothetical protein